MRATKDNLGRSEKEPRSETAAPGNQEVLSPGKGRISAFDGALVPAPSAELIELAHDVDGFVRSTRAEATRSAYAKDWRTFLEWLACPACAVPERIPQPLGLEEYAAALRRSGPVTAEVVALFVAELVRRGRKLRTIERAVASIAVLHQLAGFKPPTRERLVRDALTGVRRQLSRLGKAAPAKKAPLMTDIVVAIVRELDVNTLAGQRDAALVTFGVASMMRREEIARLMVEHVSLVPKGAEVLIRWSKTDQEGEAETIPVSFGATPHTCLSERCSAGSRLPGSSLAPSSGASTATTAWALPCPLALSRRS